MGLRHKTYSDYLASLPGARSAFNDALHKVKVTLGREEPTTLEKIESVLADTRDRVRATTDTLYNSVANIPGTISGHLPRGISSESAQEQAAEAYAAAIEKARENLENIRYNTDKALKKSGEDSCQCNAVGWRCSLAALLLYNPGPFLTVTFK